MGSFSKFAVLAYASAYILGSAEADTYMHHPRGSNNRACRNDNNTNRRNGNRLFDSQNNDKGGYSCPRAYPFACYAPNINGAGGCNNNQQGTALSDGTLQSNSAYLTNTAKQYYYEGSVLPIEWTNQHGCGTNTKLHCEMVIQYACEKDLTEGDNELPRDGTPITNNSGNNRDDEASDTIPTNADQADDYRYGRHETTAYYQRCEDTARNEGLLTLDQNLNGNDARYTRQNPNGNRNGLECPEESEYWPYWRDSPWNDVAVLTDNVALCQARAQQSQNVAPRGQCNNYNGNGKIPITQAECEPQGTWATIPARGLAAPQCILGPWTRDNHLGNAGAGVVPGQQSGLNITVPADMVGQNNCILRVRYNMSTGDSANGALGTNDPSVKEVTVTGDKTDNGAIYDRNNNEVKSYMDILGSDVGTAVNTNQYGRTFQDRSHTFAVKAAPTTGKCANQAIHNLNVRGKRGNIVQTYPSVEYDFVPNVLTVESEDCVHVAFFGSDYNPNRNPNNGEGGPPNPNNDDEAKADRTNMVAMEFERSNFPLRDGQSTNYVAGTAKMFEENTDAYRKLAFLDQTVNGQANAAGSNGACLDINTLRNIIKGNGADQREERERDSRNCAKLSGQKTPAFDGGLVKAGTVGTYAYMSTRNHNLTNRGQKGVLKVANVGAIGSGPGKLPDNANNNFGSAGAADLGSSLGIAGGVAGGLVALGAAFVAYRKMSNNRAMAGGAMTPTAGGMGGSTVTARYAHNAKEAGELSFQKGEKITVTRQDASGWWEGQNASGQRGVFPSNYVQ